VQLHKYGASVNYNEVICMYDWICNAVRERKNVDKKNWVCGAVWKIIIVVGDINIADTLEYIT
jgi:hypothetical protein